ncbi:MAG TPA: SH3 domain-containing protein [Rhabdaerophilum sp.]|nr:SH3 domain-containing protein [Rhabdaerophilum sp.]
MKSLRNHLPSLTAIVTGALLFSAAPSSATAFCHLKKTRDGFVALRAEPTSYSRLLARMKPKDEVLVGLKQEGDWVEVTWWRGNDRHRKGYESFTGRGWVHVKLIEEEC